MTVGAAYTESYLCNWGQTCIADLSQDEIEQAIAGICGAGQSVLFAGFDVSLICHGYNLNLLEWSSVTTHYSGIQVGAGAGINVTIPLSWFGAVPNRRLGWRWAMDLEKNGITFNDIVSMGN